MYDSTNEKVTVYGFPNEPEQQDCWVKSLPNKLTCKVSKYIGICAKHWPTDCHKVKLPGGSYRPIDPPSIFNTNKSYLPQTLVSKPRDIQNRGVSSETRKVLVEAPG